MVDARSIPVVNTHLVLLQLHCQQSPVEYCQLTRPFLSVKGLAGETTEDDLLAGWSTELEALLYAPEVEEAIKEVRRQLTSLIYINSCMQYATRLRPYSSCSSRTQVYPSSNPLDQKDFNPIDYINELYPSEQVCHVVYSY